MCAYSFCGIVLDVVSSKIIDAYFLTSQGVSSLRNVVKLATNF